MYLYGKFLFVYYLIFTIIIALFIVYNTCKSNKVTDKIIGGIALMMFILRILMIH